MSNLTAMNTPVFWAEGHPGRLEAAGWEISLGGLVVNPRTLTYEELISMPKTISDARLTSVSGWSVRGEWGGVRLSDLFAAAEVKPEAGHVQFTSYRGIYTTCIPLEVALQERTLLAYEFDGQPLEPTYGGPVRIFCPYLWGYKSAKCVIAIDLVERSIPGYWEERGYPDGAEIKSRQLLDVNSRQLRRIPGGEVIEFLD
jgi:DMSO/TMAO reductase YedYZ molybdopterin-dependent catalytic subunit